MERQGAWAWLAAAMVLGFGLGGCDLPPTCKHPDETRSCSCAKGKTGTQQCLPERVWGECMCAAATGKADGGMDAATTAPMSGSGGLGASGSGGSTPSTQPVDMTDEDAGGMHTPMSTGGNGGGSSGSGSGGADAGGGGGGMTGSDSGTPPATIDAYTSCTMESDCRPAGSGCVSGLQGSACQPPCKSKNDCPVPPGSYTAAVTCNADKLCVLDCTPNGSDLTPGTCPGNLACDVLLDATWVCVTP